MRRYPNPPIVVSSESGGNTIADSAAVSQTGPGSPGVVPTSDYAADNMPLPEVPAPHPTVFRVDHEPHLLNQPDGPWRYEEDVPGNTDSHWTQL